VGVQTFGTPIVLPANGPWVIHGIWGIPAWINPSGENPILGSIGIQSITGDLDPDPTPALFPHPVQQVNTINAQGLLPTPVQIHPTSFKAPGSSQIQMVAEFDGPAGVNNIRFMGGILFSANPPRVLPIQRTAMLFAQVTSAAEIALGIIQLPESADLLISYSAQAAWLLPPAANEPLLGFIRMQSDDERLQPAEFPLSFGLMGRTTAAPINDALPPVLTVPLETKVLPGSRISVFCTFPTWTATTINVKFFLNYGS
jgi:hypothetical protein